MTDKQAKALYYRTYKAAVEHRECIAKLIEYSRERFGFDFGDLNSDSLIDTLEYGIGGCIFEEFVEKMNKFKAAMQTEEEKNET